MENLQLYKYKNSFLNINISSTKIKTSTPIEPLANNEERLQRKQNGKISL